MSYILDALKKAESERERGSVPGLHSQLLPLRRPAVDTRVVATPLLLGGVVLALALSGALGWYFAGPGPAVTGASPGIVASPVPAIQGQIATAAPPMVAASAITTAPAALAKATAARTAASGATGPAASTVSPKPAPQPKTGVAVEAARAPASSPIVSVNELPADIRQTLPKTVISGSIYSDNRASRMLIINGEVYREGEKPAPDLQLEQIRAKSAVLNFKGLRYTIGY